MLKKIPPYFYEMYNKWYDGRLFRLLRFDWGIKNGVCETKKIIQTNFKSFMIFWGGRNIFFVLKRNNNTYK